jgi:hypothetical protein
LFWIPAFAGITTEIAKRPDPINKSTSRMRCLPAYPAIIYHTLALKPIQPIFALWHGVSILSAVATIMVALNRQKEVDDESQAPD